MSADLSLQPHSLRTAVILVAAGRGRRAMRDENDIPKQFRPLAEKPVLTHTLAAFLGHARISHVVVAIHSDDARMYQDCVTALGPVADAGKLLPPVHGGDSRQASVMAGLRALEASAPDLVLIHDGVRPFISSGTVSALIATLQGHPAVLAGVPVVDTVKRVDASGMIETTVPRDGLWRAATPQGFRFRRILESHQKAIDAGKPHDFTDDAAVAEWAGDRVRMVEGNHDNIKLTLPADFAVAEEKIAMQQLARLGDIRVGTGYDVHCFEDGDHVTLCGVQGPHARKLKGHSDADVALHAVTDAILGALGDGDIGQHFPPSEAQWRGAASEIFMRDALRRVAERGGMVAHIDVSLIAEAPKIGPHRQAMRESIARMTGISPDRVGVKATTNEKLGFIGRGEGIAAIATVTVRLPWSASPSDGNI